MPEAELSDDERDRVLSIFLPEYNSHHRTGFTLENMREKKHDPSSD